MNNTSKERLSRLVICDPVCLFPYGHNVAAMENFKTFVGKYFEDVVSMGSKMLPAKIAERFHITQFFDYYYNDVMPFSTVDLEPSLPRTHEEKLAAAKCDLARLVDQCQISGDDTLCFPSIDFYSLFALAESTDLLLSVGNPKLLIRMIGVMETASSGRYAKPLNVVIGLLNSLYEAGLSVRLAAETPRYAEHLAIQLNRPVAVAANIEMREQVAQAQSDHFTVICPGSARYDKGFLNLAELFTSVRRGDPHMRIRFITQVLPDRDLKHQIDYLVRLYAIPGTAILPSQLSPEELAKLYEQADLVLLPYARDVYEFRGSAVLIEAMMCGRHCLALEGSAFVDQMRYFGSGTACQSIAEMATKILALSTEAPSTRHARATQARARFARDLVSSYRDWVI